MERYAARRWGIDVGIRTASLSRAFVRARRYGRLLPWLLWSWALAAGSAPLLAPASESVTEVLRKLERGEYRSELTASHLAALGKRLPPGDSPERRRYDRVRCTQLMNDGGSLDEVRQFAEQQLRAAEARQDTPAIIDFLVCRGWTAYVTAAAEGAHQDFKRAIALAEQQPDRRQLALSLSSYGEMLSYLGDYGGALLMLTRAQPLYEQLTMRSLGLYNLSSVANTNRRLGDYAKAEQYYRQLIAAYAADGEQFYLAQMEYELGQVYADKGQCAEALPYFSKSQAVYRRMGDAVTAAYSYRGIVTCQVQLQRYAAALDAIAAMRPTMVQLQDRINLAYLLLNEGQALKGLKRYAEAKNVLAQAQTMDVIKDNPRWQAQLFETQGEVFAAQGQWEQAYQAFSRYKSAHQQVDKELAERDTTRLRIQFDSERTEAENRRLQSEAALKEQALRALEVTRRWQLAALVLGALVLLTLLSLGVRQLLRSRRLAILALTDELTGIANRRQIELLGREAVNHARTSAGALAVLVFDIDHFKRINDSYGHAVGDTVLRGVAEAASAALRDIDRVGRMGGEEFLVVLPGAPLAQAVRVAERLRARIAMLVFPELAADHRVTISIGVAERLTTEATLEALVARADAALYQAKQQGRDRVVCA